MEKTIQKTKAYLLLVERKSDFLKQIDSAVSFAEDMLPQINRIFNTYTIHGMKHAVNVVEYMYDLVDDVNQLTDLEISMMIYAALFHDIGMIASEDEIRKIKEDIICLNDRKYSKVLDKYSDEQIALQECVRPVHGLRSRQFIETICPENKALFLIPGTTSIYFDKELALICQAHTEDFHWLISNLKCDTAKGDYYINMQYMACLLRIGDYLDIDEQRAPLYLYKYLNPQEHSDLEWKQHFKIENFEKIQLDDKTGLKEIVFQGQSEEAAVHRKLLKYFDGISQELLNVVKLSEKFEDEKYLLRLKTHVINKIDTPNFSFSDFRLKLDYGAVTKLLMGEFIYGNKMYGLREIIQNSIDACKTMQETAEKHPAFRFQKYEPFINIVINQDERNIMIIDNGSGMSVDVLKKYFLNVGMSYYKSDDYVLQGKKYSPIGHFGIGFLACFMLSDKVQVTTKSIDEPKTIKIDFEKNSEYICMTFEDTYRNCGTEILLEYDSFMNTFENNSKLILNFLERNFLDCDIPIKISVLSEGQITDTFCELKKIETAIPNSVCLDKYLNDIQVYLAGEFSHIKFAGMIEELNNCESFYYDSCKNSLIEEQELQLSIKEFVEDGVLQLINIPIIDFDEEEEFKKAYDVLDDFDSALDKLGGSRSVNFVSLHKLDWMNEELVENDNDEIIGDYRFADFCEHFGHSWEVPTKGEILEYSVIVDDEADRILPYNKDVPFEGDWFRRGDKTYMKNVLLPQFKLSFPCVLKGIRLKEGIINISNELFVPNVSRDNMNAELTEVLSYAIGKALHLWLLDNVEFSSKERKLVEDFIERCYPNDNFCLKKDKSKC